MNQLKSEAEAKFAAEKGYQEPEFKSIFSWLTFNFFIRALLVVFIILLSLLVAIGIQSIKLELSAVHMSLSFVLPDFEKYTPLGCVIQIAWLCIALLFGAFMAGVTLIFLDDDTDEPK